MEEALVLFETAKLAEEKGFSQENYYLTKEQINILDPRIVTQSLLAKWLREVHNLFIKIDFFIDDEIDKLVYDYCISNLSHPFKENEIDEDYVIDYSVTRNFETYEQALEEGLFEALKLIKNDTN